MFRIRAAARLSALFSLTLGVMSAGGRAASGVSRGPAVANACVGPLSADGVVRCAVQQDLDVQLAQKELRVLAGRRITAGTWLPSHPVVAMTDSLSSPLKRLRAVPLLVSEVDVGAFRALSAPFALAIALAVAVGAAREDIANGTG